MTVNRQIRNAIRNYEESLAAINCHFRERNKSTDERESLRYWMKQAKYWQESIIGWGQLAKRS